MRALIGLMGILAGCGGEEPAGTDTSAAGDTADTADTAGGDAADTDAGDTGDTDSGDTGAESGGDSADSADTAAGCAALPLCDGFEADTPGAAPDPARWEVLAPDCAGTGTLAVDDAQAHSGARSVRVDGGGGYCDHVFLRSGAVAAIEGPLHVRFHVRFDAPLGESHVTFLAMPDAADGGQPLRMGGQAGILMWNRASDDATLPVLSPAGIATSLAPEAGRWYCVEVAIDGAAGTLETRVDGAVVEGLHIDGTPTPEIDERWLDRAWNPAPTELRIGWESYAGQAATLWFDDVAVAGERIGCAGE